MEEGASLSHHQQQHHLPTVLETPVQHEDYGREFVDE
jgi:hypothetical protein